MLVPKQHPKREPPARRARTSEGIELSELRKAEAEASRAEDRARNQGRREELEIEREKVALDSGRLERGRRWAALARESIGLTKDAATAALWFVVTAILIVAALKGPEPYTALAILCVLVGGRGVNVFRGRSGG